MNRYPEYKDSGVQWLGEVPEHWGVSKIRHIAEIVTGNTPPKSNDENYRDGVHPWVKPDELADLEPVLDSKEKLSDAGREAARVVPAGSVMVCCIGSIGKMGVAGRDVATNQQINSIVFRREMMSPEYGKFLVSALKEEHVRFASSVVLPILSKSTQGEIRLPVPPLKEQRQMAAYLDRKTGEIDTLIRKKQALIALLREQRTALIHRAVTKGLDPDVPMKDSGVEWLGEVPEHWTVPKVKHLLSSSLAYGVLKPERYEGDDAVPLIRIKDVDRGVVDENGLVYISPEQSEEYSRTRVAEGDLIVSVVGTLGKSFIVPASLAGANLSRALARVQAVEDVDVRWFRYYFQSEAFERSVDFTAMGSAQRVLNLGDLGNFHVPLPPYEEQLEIAHHLNGEVGSIGALIDREQETIRLLRELRTSLISEVVTGKIDVRNEVPASNGAPVATQSEEVAV